MRAGWRIRRLADGSVIVASRVRAALAPVDADGELRLLATGARCGAAGWAVVELLGSPHTSPLWIAGGAGAWCIAAWHTEEEDEPAADEQQPVTPPAADAAPAHSDAEIYEGLVDYLRRLIADRNGVHLTEALNGLQAQGLAAITMSAAEFGRHLQRRGIPVRASIKVTGSVGPGVHRDDLPAAAEPLPEAAPVAAG